jgi:cytoskeletal protein CcmA (bactofilin family)
MGFFGELKQDLSQVAGDELKRERADAEAERILAGAQLAGLDEADSVLRSVSSDHDSTDDNDDVAALLKDLVAGLGSEDEAVAEEVDHTSDVSDDISSILAGLAMDDMPLAKERSVAEAEKPEPAFQEKTEALQTSDEQSGNTSEASDNAFASHGKNVESEDVPSESDGVQKAEESVTNDEPDKNDEFFLNEVFTTGDSTQSEETSVITEGMVINGNIESAGNLELKGRVNGDITVSGKLDVTGYITGNSTANEVYAENAKIVGNINSESLVRIGTGTVVVGNISAFGAAIAGAVKGDIDVHGPVILDSTAIVKGNIRSKSVQINNGAVLEGVCSQAYAEVSPTDFFDEYKPETGD